MVQCLERSGFDMENDQLIFLGDVVDGWPDSKESIELLLCIKHLVYLLGNHDKWALDYYTGKMAGHNDDFDQEHRMWLMQGGDATVNSYGKGRPMVQEHLELLQTARYYYVSEDNILFVHAGFEPEKPIEETVPDYLIWGREFVTDNYKMYVKKLPIHIAAYKEVYIGHTPTIGFDREQTTPLQMGNITVIDTGAAFTGCLSIMDIDSKELWQSDKVMRLYPDQEGRNSISYHAMKQSGMKF